MAVGLKLTFTTDVYRGRDANGTPESLPDTSRLMSALVSAAARSPLGLEASRDALEWFENNPPTSMTVPDSIFQLCEKSQHFFNHSTKTRRADEKKKGKNDKKTVPVAVKVEKPFTRYKYLADYAYGFVVRGEVAWGWDDVPENHAKVFAELTRFVSYVGDPDSVVKLTWGKLDPVTHTLMSPGEIPVAGSVRGFAPVEGRLAELDARHARIQAGKAKSSERADQAISAARDLAIDLRHKVGSVTYVPVEVPVEAALDSPWDAAVWFPMSKEFAVEDRAREAGVIHRNLVRLFSNIYSDRCAVLHGRNAVLDTEHRAANNVAIQFIPNGYEHVKGTSPGMLVMTPKDAPLGDRDALLDMLVAYSPVHPLISRVGEEVDPTRWWLPPTAGTRRTWHTYPLAVSEGVNAPPHVLAAKSLKYVFRDTMSSDEAHNAVLRSRRVDPHVGLSAFIHRTNTSKKETVGGQHIGLDVRYDLSGLSHDSAVVAVGQSRHFGVGLLVPFDVPNQ